MGNVGMMCTTSRPRHDHAERYKSDFSYKHTTA